MKTEDLDILREMYRAITALPSVHADKLEEVVSNSYSQGSDCVNYTKLSFNYNSYRGIKGRKLIWKEYLRPILSNQLLDNIVENNAPNVSANYYNTLFRSKCSVKENGEPILTVRSPMFSTFLGKLLGKRIKAKFKCPSIR